MDKAIEICYKVPNSYGHVAPFFANSPHLQPEIQIQAVLLLVMDSKIRVTTGIKNQEASISEQFVLDHASGEGLGDVIEMVPRFLETEPDATNNPAAMTLRTKTQVRQENIQFATLCWCMFVEGWDAGSPGPLIPRFREYYHVGFTIVSLLFVLSSTGFILGVLLNIPLTDKLGFGKLMVLGSCCSCIAYIIISCAPPFPLFVIAFALDGMGMAIMDAQSNGYVSTLPKSADSQMGILHAAFGAGALCSPLVSTYFAQAKHWSFHYFTGLGVTLLNTALLAVAFRFRSHQDCLSTIGLPPVPQENSEHGRFRQILGQKLVHILAFFIFVYVGIEVTLGGWIVTYIIDVRKGGPSSGYISSGFFGGLMLGRVALLWVNKKLGERTALYLYAMIAIGLEFVIWFVPSLVGDAVTVSIVGMLLGPVYPIVMNVAGQVLPGRILTGSIGWIAGFGQAGSALFPFITGALASKFGIKSLQPLVIAMMASMVIIWTLVPRKRPHSD